MDKETYARVKRAYQITVEGCGQDCFNCEREVCLADTRKVRKDAKRWIYQKKIEREFYKQNKARRSAAAKERYDRLYKVENPMECRKIKNDLLFNLPDRFDYDTAAKAWLVEYSTASERIKRFISRGFLVKQRIGNRVFFNKTGLYFKTFGGNINVQK